MENVSSELIEYVKRNQYSLTYELVKDIEIMAPDNPTLEGKSIGELVANYPEIREVISNDNLVLLYCGAKKEDASAILDEMENRARNGKELFYGPRVECQFFSTFEFNTSSFVHLFRKYPNMKERIITDEYKAIKKNPRLMDLAGKVKTLIAVETLYMSQIKGLINDKSLDFLEMLYAENPNIIDNISMFMLEPDIMNMNEDFLKRVSRYKDQSSELVAIYKTNPEIFKAFSKKIDEWENSLSVREATRYEKDILRYAVAYGAYMNDAKEEDFDDVLNYCIRKAQYDFGEKYPYTVDYEEFFSKKCDELFEKKSFVDTMTMVNKVNAYTMKYLGTTYKEAQKTVERKYAQLKLDEIEDPEVRDYISKVLEVVSLDIENPEDMQKLEILYKSNPKTYKPVMTIKAEEMANRALLKSYEEGFKATKEKIDSSEDIEMVDYNGSKVRMMKLSGSFSMIIRSTDTGFKADRELPNDSVKQYEDANPDSRVGIKSCSYITEDFPGIAPLGENGVYMIYTDVDSSKIGEIANGDLDSNIINYGVTSKQSKSFYRDELVDNSRQVYAEATIIGKKDPDAIALFSDATERQRSLAIKTAAVSGVDFVYIDKEKLVEEQIERLAGYIKDFCETGDLNKLEVLLSKYETNIAGWLLNRDKDVPDESMFIDIDNSRFESDFNEVERGIYKAISDYCNTQYSAGNKENINRVYSILNVEKSKYDNLNEGRVYPKMKMKFKAEELMKIINRRFELGHDIDKEKPEPLNELAVGMLTFEEFIGELMSKDFPRTNSIVEGKQLIEELEKTNEVTLDEQLRMLIVK